MDPGKGSKRRPGNTEAYKDNYDKIFGKKKVSAGRRYYRWDSDQRTFVEIDPPAPLPKDLRFEGTNITTEDGSRIRKRTHLHDHNQKHGVTQILPGMEQDIEDTRKDIHDKAFGKQAREQRIEDVKRAIVSMKL